MKKLIFFALTLIFTVSLVNAQSSLTPLKFAKDNYVHEYTVKLTA